MAALTAPRKTAKVGGNTIVLTINSGSVIYPGALVAINAAGKAVPASKAEDLTAAGCAIVVDDKIVIAERGVFLWENDTANAVTIAHIGQLCYMADDQTVTSLSTGSSAAGKVLGFENGMVIVETR